MSRCRATSFYLAPGELRYFSDHTTAVQNPDTGEMHEIRHRQHIAEFAAAHPGWNGVLYVGPAGGLDALAFALEHEPSSVEMFRTSERIIEGRRPEDPATYTLAQWANKGFAEAGGARQIAATLFPGAGRSVGGKATALVEHDSMWSAQILGAAWRAGLIDDPHMASRLLNQALETSYPARTTPEMMLEPLMNHLRELSEAGVKLDVEAILAELSDLNTQLDPGAVVRLLGHPDCPEAFLEAHAVSEDMETRIAVAEHPSTPPHTLARLATEDGSASVAISARNNPATPPEFRQKLYDTAPLHAAKDPNTPGEKLSEYATAESRIRRAAVAANPSCPEQHFPDLAADPEAIVRSGVARNPSAPEHVLAELAGDGDHSVLTNLAGNTACPDEVAADMVDAAIEGIRSAETRESIREHEDMLEIIARNPGSSPETLGRIATGGHITARRWVARNPNTSAEDRAALARDKAAVVRYALAQREDADPDELDILAGDTFGGVRTETARNPNTRTKTLVRLAGDERPETRAAAAANMKLPYENIPKSTLEQHPDVAQYRQILERRPLTLSPSTLIAGAMLIPSDETGRIRSVKDITIRAGSPLGPTENRKLASDASGEKDDFTIKPVITTEGLEDNANHMGNCSNGLAPAISRGNTLLFKLDDARTGEELNVSLERDGDRWRIGEINTRYNRGTPPELEERAIGVFKHLLG